MPREKPLFRENLDRLDKKFPDVEVLRYADISEYLGISLRTAKTHYQKYYNKQICGISKTVLANILS